MVVEGVGLAEAREARDERRRVNLEHGVCARGST